MVNKKNGWVIIGISIILVFVVMVHSYADNERRTLTLRIIDIPDRFNGKYISLEGFNVDIDLGIYGGGDGVRISNGEVSIPIWLEFENRETSGRTFYINLNLYDSPTLEGEIFAKFYLESIRFANATISFQDAEEVDLN